MAAGPPSRSTAVTAVAILLGLLAWLLLLPGPPWPVSPTQVERLLPAQMAAIIGDAGRVDGGALDVLLAEGDMAMQVIDIDIDAANTPILRYAMSGFPRTLELALVWRRAEDPEQSHSVSLPAPRGQTRAFDLSRLPGWHGRISEIGLAQFPVRQQVPPGRGFEPFRIHALRLESPTLGNGLRRHLDALLAPRPWSHSSINSLGRELHVDARSPLPPVVAGIGVFGAVWWLLAYQQGRPRPWRALIAATTLGWLLLDLGWQQRLLEQNRLTRSIADVGGQGDASVIASARRIAEWLPIRRAPNKVIVIAKGSYAEYRIAYHLLPVDVAVSGSGVVLQGDALPVGLLLVVHDQVGAELVDGQLSWSDRRLASVIELHRDGNLVVYEYLGDEDGL